MSERSRSDVWLSILGSILSGVDVASLASPEAILKLTDKLEEGHMNRFDDAGRKRRPLPAVQSPGEAEAIVRRWSSKGGSSARIMCIKELRREFKWDLPEAKAYMDRHWK